MTEYDLLVTDWREVTDSILLEVKRPKIETAHNMNDIKHLRVCSECDQLQGKQEDDAREEAENE